ncbi:MAG: hypothetical protein LUC94_02000, partial [Clostridiales bacterium]|nr:hypothetical protein [Clostridiales bacterium]
KLKVNCPPGSSPKANFVQGQKSAGSLRETKKSCFRLLSIDPKRKNTKLKKEEGEPDPQWIVQRQSQRVWFCCVKGVQTG